MNKGLEAWKRLNEHDSNDESYWYGEQFGKDKETIEKELKALEIIKSIVKDNMGEWGNVDFNINDYPLLKEVLL